MSSGADQHIVPRQMIKRFAGADGKLIELFKPTLTIGTRRRAPSGILFKENFYLDRFSDFDQELLKTVEQNFGQYYPQIADEEKPQTLCGDGGAALIDWIAAMLCRTRALVSLSCAIVESEDSQYSVFWKIAPAEMDNLMRTIWFTQCQDILTRSDFCWKIRILPDGQNLVITDHPVCQTSGLNNGGQVTIVPLSKNRLLIGGLRDAVENYGYTTAEQLNLFLAAWAEQFIFAADTDTLENVKKHLEGKGDIVTKEWCEQARKPFGGMAERIKSKKIPSEINISQWWEDMKNSYGKPLSEQNELEE